MSGYLSGWPEATTPELDAYYHHYHGGSSSARPPHAECGGACPFPAYADPPHNPYAAAEGFLRPREAAREEPEAEL